MWPRPAARQLSAVAYERDDVAADRWHDQITSVFSSEQLILIDES